MKSVIQRILAALAWVGILLGQNALARDWAVPTSHSESAAEVIPKGTVDPASSPPAEEVRMPTDAAFMVESDGSVVGERSMAVGGVFGDNVSPACEFCGGGGCMPPTWTFDSSIVVLASSRPANRVLTTNAIPGGPYQVTSGTGSAAQYRYFNDAIQSPLIETHTLNPGVSPAWQFKISRFLGRDGSNRDHLLDLEYTGLAKYSAKSVVQGSIVPVYGTTAFTDPTTSPTTIGFRGSLISPFVLPTAAQPLDPTNAYAFNHATEQAAYIESSFNSWELNYRFAGNNRLDQLVMHPNGRWYRQCKTGYFHSYLMGLRVLSIDEKFEYLSRGAAFNRDGNLSLTNEGRYVVRSSNTLLGLQTGGTLEYRFCRWKFETHGKAGMFINLANQASLIQTSLHGYLDNDVNQPVNSNTSSPFDANGSVVSFAGGFGVAGSYKFRPNIVGHVSYDMFWVGNIARASEQMSFEARPPSFLDTKGSQFYNGVTLGLEFDW